MQLFKDIFENKDIKKIGYKQKLDYILQKSTELGVSKIILYYSERGIVKENDKSLKKIQRWKMILKEF